MIYALPLAGKPLAEHLLDLCTVFGAERALVLDYNLDLAFRRRLESQEHRWPLQISYEGASLCPDVQALTGRNAAFIGESETLIFRGPILPQTGTLEDVFDRLDVYLPDLPEHVRATLTPRSSRIPSCGPLSAWQVPVLPIWRAELDEMSPLQAADTSGEPWLESAVASRG